MSSPINSPILSPVQVLKDSVARRIAAGEVIDRPYAALRELLDNAIDSGARNITVNLYGGGIDEIRVSDDGAGMAEADLKLCWLPHATSKIRSLADLERIDTLGFRGEALSSMAACARLELVSNPSDQAFKLSVHGGKLLEIAPATGSSGTTVSVRELFFNMPARRQFLKSRRAEGSRCRRIYLEKAAAHPGINFRLFVDGVMKVYLPAGSQAERVRAGWPNLAPAGGWWESSGSSEGVRLTVVHARPEISRKDRQYIQIYANRRRIDEFSLVQAMSVAYDAWMPGGVFPAAFVFIEVDPHLVDFNIHPAKKEARFRDLPAIRHLLIETVRDRITAETYRTRAKARSSSGEESHRDLPATGNWVSQPGSGFSRGNFSNTKNIPSGDSVYDRRRQSEAFASVAGEIRDDRRHNRRLDRFVPTPPEKDADFRYLGQVMGVFLVAESGGSLYIVDQHAAHERILFEKFRSSDAASEKLLIPRPLELDESALMRLELRKERLKALGMDFRQTDEKRWELTALPEAARGLEDEIVEFIEHGGGEAEGLEKSLWADLSCKAAVKDNSVLDEEAARKLLGDAFNLESPRCPHGRPIWFEVSRDELFELVGRTV